MTNDPSSDPRRHPLFRRYPLSGQVLLSTGPAPTPYHVYDGHGVFVGGSADLAAARALLAPEQLAPATTTDGRALMGVWIFDFTDASLGAHHELQFSLWAGPVNSRPVAPHAFAAIDVMLTRPDLRMMCHGLWNNTPRVVAYNRELLGLDARESHSLIDARGPALEFAVDDAQTQETVLQGRFHRPHRQSLRAGLSLASRVGWRTLARVAREPWLRTPVVNPIGSVVDRNASADSFTKARRSLLRRFDPAGDHLEFGDTRYQRLGFQPQFVQFMEGFRFVYMAPKA